MSYRDSVFWSDGDNPTAFFDAITTEIENSTEEIQESFSNLLDNITSNMSNLRNNLQEVISEFSENMTYLMSYNDPVSGDPIPVMKEAFIQIVDEEARGAIDVLSKGLIDENPSGEEYSLLYLVARRAIQVILNKESEIQEVTLESPTQ